MDDFAGWFLTAMPFTFAAKTGAILWSTIVQAQQRPVSRLGWLILIFFVFLTLTSAGLTGMFGQLAWAFHDAPGLSPWLRWMIPVEVFSTGVAVFGALMMREERRERIRRRRQRQ